MMSRKFIVNALYCLFFTCSFGIATAQQSIDTIPGVVSYKTSQHIYVRFSSTANINPGDTLFIFREGNMKPALLVKHISSTSCVTLALSEPAPEIGARLVAKNKKAAEPVVSQGEIEKEVASQIYNHPDSIDPAPLAETEPGKQVTKPKESLKGRITAASYLNASDHPEYDRQRMRYTFSMNAAHIGNSKFSLESYVSFRHTINEWEEVRENFNRVFKIYALALQYDINESTSLSFGRKINYNLSNIGAIDGVQAEKKWSRYFTGAFVGSRPDHTDYHFNFDLLQFGAYAGNKIEGKNGSMQNTLAFAEQRNHNVTDRRFGYFQHMNSLIRRIYIFTSFEFDLYTLRNDQPTNTFDISSIYASIRYRVSDKLSVFGSYDARKNIIYYETYKNFIDQLLEDETRQGFRFSFNYRPIKFVTLGTSAGYRFQKDNPNDSKNLHSYLTFSKVPVLNASTTLSATFIQSTYLTGWIYGVRLSRDLVKGKLYSELAYRFVNYQYQNIEVPLTQSIAGLNLSWRMTKKLSFGVNYEGEFQGKSLAHRVYTNLTHRL